MSQDSLKKRYTSKLASNLVKFVLGFVTLGMVPRALGPETYGDFGFLTNFFTRTTKFLKFGIPTAYYTKLSNRSEEKKLIGFYIYFIVILICLVFSATFGAITVGFQQIIWPEQKGIYIFAAALFGVLSIVSESFRITIDALGYTVKYEMRIILQSIFASILIVVLYFTNILSIKSLFLMHYLLLLFLIVTGWGILRKNNIFIKEQLSLKKKEVKSYIKEFYHFSHPLFFNGLVVYFVVIGDRWLLQYFYGSAEQGFYTLALKIGGIIFLFTSSLSTLLIREMSFSFKNKEKKEIRRLFKRYIPLFYFVAAYIAVFISLNANDISFFIGGAEYKNASIIIATMAFYPVHQTYGQLGGAVFLATEQTKIIRNIGVSSGLLGLIISFLLILPRDFYGQGMGAFGLALKMIIVQFITVNIYLWVNTRFLKLSFRKFIGHQLLVLGVLFIFAKLAQYFTVIITGQLLMGFLISGITYTIFVVLLIVMYPRIIIMERSELMDYKNMLLEIINKTKKGKIL